VAGRTAIGLDIGTSVVRAVELSYGRGGLTLERFGQVVLPDGAVTDGEVTDREPVTQCIKQLWSATGFTHKRVVLGVANQRVIVRQLDLPWMEQGELRAGLPFQVQDLLPMPTDQAVMDFYPMEEITQDGRRTLRGLLVAASKDTVLSNVTCAASAGLKVTSVDLTSFAVLRALGKQSGLEIETEALIDIGARVTNVVVHSSGVPRFVRILLMGGQDITDAVAQETGSTLMEAEALKQQYSIMGAGRGEFDSVQRAVVTTVSDFVDEIRGSLDYFAASNPGIRVQRILVSGGGSRLEGILDRLSDATRMPVVPGDPLVSLRMGRTGLDQQQLEFVRPLATVPVGLALGAL
jgi:type IV pilus assembly protein PilM